MTRTSRLESYLSDLTREFRIRGVIDPQALEEIRTHLEESLAAELRTGLDRQKAEEQVIRRFGSAPQIANRYLVERMTRMETFLLAAGTLLGVAIAVIDSRPTWDDTGITVFALLAVSALLGLISPRRPWRWALAVGVWLPAYEIFLTHNYSLVFILLIPMIGAFVGAGAGWVIRKALHPA